MPLGTPDPRDAVRCQSCATSVAGGSSFCAACGTALAQHTEASDIACPGCRAGAMVLWGLAPSAARPQGLPVHGCRSCGGAWVDAQTLHVVLEAASARAPMEGHGVGDRGVRRRTMPPGTATAKIVYRKCPACGQSMLRRNFARVSGVIVDQCGHHGTYFDAGELEDILDFVRSGGLALAKRRDDTERASLERQRLHTAAMKASSPGMGPAWMEAGYEHHDASWAFMSWAGRWVRNLFRDR